MIVISLIYDKEIRTAHLVFIELWPPHSHISYDPYFLHLNQSNSPQVEDQWMR